jgi:ferredoxin
MTYVIGNECVDVTDRSCIEECPVEAIRYEDDLPDDQRQHLADNAAFFTETLAGRDAPLSSPGGAVKVGPLGVDTPLVAGMPVDAQ